MELKKIKVKATDEIRKYRCVAIGISKKDFRALQQGKEALIPNSLLKKYKFFQEVKDGN